MSLRSRSESSALFKCAAFRVLRTAIFLSLFPFMCEMIRVVVLRNCLNIKLLCADNIFFSIKIKETVGAVIHSHLLAAPVTVFPAILVLVL